MGKTGRKNRYWSKNEKLRIVLRVMNGYESTWDVSRSEKISNGMLNGWIKKYKEGGAAALENSKKPGNPLSKYSRKKELTEIEQLEYENMKLRIENERLKKGYMMKGDGSVVIFRK